MEDTQNLIKDVIIQTQRDLLKERMFICAVDEFFMATFSLIYAIAIFISRVCHSHI